VAKLKLNEKRVQLSFQRPEDVALYERLEKMAYDGRWDMPTFLLLALQQAFPLPDKGEESLPELQELPRNQPPAMGTDLGQSHHSLTDALDGSYEHIPSR
jgi:hypothetical protein